MMLKSIKTKILVTQLGLVICVSVLISFTAYFLMTDPLKKQQQEHLTYIANDVSEHISTVIERKKEIFERLVSDKSITDYLRTYNQLGLIEYLSKFKSQFPIISYVNEDGMEELKLVNGKLAEELSDISDTVIYEETTWETNKVFVEFTTDFSGSPEAYLEFGYCNYSFFDEFDGLTVARIPLANIASDIREFKVGETGFLILLNEDGTILSHHDQDKILAKLPLENEQAEHLAQQIKSPKKICCYTTIFGVDSYAACAPVEGMNWVIVAILPYKEYMAAPTSLRNATTLIFLIVLASGTLVSLAIASGIAKPILKLVDVTGVVARGDLSQKVQLKSKDEIGTLGQAFNRMIEDLQKTTTSIDKLNAEVNERKKAEHQLKLSKEQIEQALQTNNLILESMPVGILIVGKDKKIRRVNKAALEMMEYGSPEEVIGNICHKNICPAEVDKCPVIDLDKTVDNSEKVLLNRYGHEIPILKSVLPITLDGEEVFLEAFVDISERKKAEQKLENAYAELAKSSKQLEEFAYISSHDLREPVRRIIAFTELLSKSLAGRLSDDEQENLELILDGTDRMSQMVNSMLTYWQLTTDAVKFKKVDLNEIVRQLKDKELSNTLAETAGTINIPQASPVVYADANLMQQLLLHLIANALRYCKESVQPEVTISAHSTDDGMIRIRVQDNGIGIKSEQFEKIFTMFRRLNPKEKSDGPGVGLTMCRRIVERHNGDIGVESEYGQGSTFWFTVPAFRPSQQQQQLETANAKA